jgi:uncharacterized protein (TIGR02246 family)
MTRASAPDANVLRGGGPAAAPPIAAKSVPAATITAADRAEIQSVIRRWEAAWQAHDPAAWAALFHDDATWVLWTGAEWHGRAAIAAGIAGPFRTVYANSTQLSKLVEIRPIARDAAVVRSLTTLTGDTRQPGATIYGNKILVMTRRNGKWGILYGQNTRLTDAEAANLRSAP